MSKPDAPRDSPNSDSFSNIPHAWLSTPLSAPWAGPCPNLVSGSIIVSVVLSLPTTGPLLLRSLLTQDMYLASSFLLMLSTLTIVGTLVSDILLALLDPRIRMGG